MGRVLVTGAAGLVGGAVCRRLAARGEDVVALDARAAEGVLPVALEDMNGLAAAADGPLDAIVHCGAVSGPMMEKGRPARIVSANVLGLANVLEIARLRGVRRVVTCSSIGVYGDAPGGPGPEHHALLPTSVYGATKVAGEALAQGYAAEFGVASVSLRIARIYGPGRRGDCHIKRAIEGWRDGVPVRLAGDPDFLFHYVWIGDVVDAIAAALAREAPGHVALNVSGQRPQPLSEVADTLREALPGLDLAIEPGEDDVADIHHWFDLDAARRVLGWTPATDLRSGIGHYAEHLRERRP